MRLFLTSKNHGGSKKEKGKGINSEETQTIKFQIPKLTNQIP